MGFLVIIFFMLKPEILYISFDQLDIGKGAAIHISKFAEILQKNYCLTLITIGRSDREIRWQQTRRLEFGLSATNLLDRVDIFRKKLRQHLGSHSYQVIQFRSIWEGQVICEYSNNAKLIYEVNGLPSIELKYHYPRLVTDTEFINRLRQQELQTLIAAHRIITPAAVSGRFLESLGISSSKIQIIPNGVDLSLFKPLTRPRQDNHCDKEAIELIYIGTQAPWQGIDILLAALKLVVAERPFRLIVIGRARKEWLRAHLALAREYQLVEMITFIEEATQVEIAAQLARADIAIAPLAALDRNLLQGCSPIKLFEYAACARPIIAADIAAVREIFTDNENILLYSPTEPRQLAAQILRLARDSRLRAELGQAAHRLITARYSWQRAQRALENVYQELLTGDQSS
jgi:glycosyltransferase involved in cell wall biosynthesis